MPEFILDHGTPDTARQFKALDSFTQGYIEAMFFTDTEPGTYRAAEDEDRSINGDRIWDPETQSSLPGDATVADLAPQTLARIVRDCAKFQEANTTALAAATELEPGSPVFKYARNVLDDQRLGQLFWYARCGHGVSFCDDGNADCLQDLQKAAQAVGNVDTYVGDDGLIYLEPVRHNPEAFDIGWLFFDKS